MQILAGATVLYIYHIDYPHFSFFYLLLCTAHSPDIPLEDRMASNVTIEGPMTAQQDYRFTVTVTWKAPVYQNITPSMYFVKLSNENSIKISPPAVREITCCVLNIS